MRILVVEDRPRMAALLKRTLRSQGHFVTIASDGGQAMILGRAEDLDVILLDVALPVVDGFTVLRQLREERLTTSIIMVTARDAMIDVIRGLDLGADDYLTKPFALDILLARIRAVARRGQNATTDTLQFEDLLISKQTYELLRKGRSTPLTRTEFALLEKLIRNAGFIVTKDALIEAGWGLGADVSENSLHVFIRTLRHKIAVEGEAQLLHTARGIGYTLRARAH